MVTEHGHRIKFVKLKTQKLKRASFFVVTLQLIIAWLDEISWISRQKLDNLEKFTFYFKKMFIGNLVLFKNAFSSRELRNFRI